MSRSWVRRRSRLPVRSVERAAQLAQLGLQARTRDHHLAGLVDQAVQQLRAHAHRLVRRGALRRQVGDHRPGQQARAGRRGRSGLGNRRRHRRVAARLARAVHRLAASARGLGTRRLRRQAVHRSRAGMSKLACMPSNRCSRGSSPRRQRASEPRRSISDSMRWASSPSRNAPASRALPLRVCNARNTSSRALRLSGRAVHWRNAPPSWGMSSTASSSKIGNRSGSIASTMSMSSWSSPKSDDSAARQVRSRRNRSGDAGVERRGATGPTLRTNAARARSPAGDARGWSSSRKLVLWQVRALRNRQLFQGLQRVDDARVGLLQEAGGELVQQAPDFLGCVDEGLRRAARAIGQRLGVLQRLSSARAISDSA